jgi:hypothetical protein
VRPAVIRKFMAREFEQDHTIVESRLGDHSLCQVVKQTPHFAARPQPQLCDQVSAVNG